MPLNRRRIHGNPPLSVLELERWALLRELLEYELGATPPVGAATPRTLRVPTHLKVRYGADADHIGNLRNVSEGGLFVETSEPLAPGTPLRLEIEAGSGMAPIHVDAVVVWNRDIANRDGPAGFGAHFRDLEAEEFESIARLVEDRLNEIGGPLSD